ncbi:MAG: anhydro-N-acetylmuramic acid kinase [Leptolyngbyaceae cyanobacterium MO_188.B28]|nr:anhydro-N-acetylmuramic acid kinase [Leptolyngbyaceae cyanobacterium MO_188.B28]
MGNNSEGMRVIGLMSGTSIDGIDAALVEINGAGFNLEARLVAGATYPYPDQLRHRILAVCSGGALTLAELAALDDSIAYQFAQAALRIQTDQASVQLIGSHGQTVYHRPPHIPQPETLARLKENEPGPISLGYSLQLGRGALIAQLTGIPTISNFRAADIAVGGQGAPLVPPVDACLLSHPHDCRCIQNLGGMANVTYLPAWDKRQPNADMPSIMGWDTGPGNVLLDLAVHHLSDGKLAYDLNGEWASQGKPCSPLIEQWLQHPFFQQPPPKSTGRELFGQGYLQQCLQEADAYQLTPADFLATLTDLTAASIAQSYRTFLPQLPAQVFLCGGGSQNLYLRQRLQHWLAPIVVSTTDEQGISSAYKEAIAFAILAFWRKHGIPANSPSVTGAKTAVAMGEIYPI